MQIYQANESTTIHRVCLQGNCCLRWCILYRCNCLIHVSLVFTNETHRLIASGTGIFPNNVSFLSTVNMTPSFFYEISKKFLMHMATHWVIPLSKLMYNIKNLYEWHWKMAFITGNAVCNRPDIMGLPQVSNGCCGILEKKTFHSD